MHEVAWEPMMNSTNLSTTPSSEPWVQVLGSRHFSAWLAEQNVSLAFTTYQAGKLFLVGRQVDERISVFERTFKRCMGLWADGPSIWLSSLYQLWRLENGLRPGQRHDGYDAVFVPRVGYTTGDIDTHDLAVESDGHTSIQMRTLLTARPRRFGIVVMSDASRVLRAPRAGCSPRDRHRVPRSANKNWLPDMT